MDSEHSDDESYNEFICMSDDEKENVKQQKTKPKQFDLMIRFTKGIAGVTDLFCFSGFQ